MDNIYGKTLMSPDVDFRAVYDGRRAPFLHYDVELDTARSIAAGTQLVLNIAGDSFYSDMDPDNQGIAVVHFQDTSLSAQGAPVYVTRGSIFHTPFTRLLIENTAQPGKRLRIFYGVNVDFAPGATSSVDITGTVTPADIYKKLTDDGIAASAFVPLTAAAGLYPVITLYNPAASGRTLYVRQLIIHSIVNALGISVRRQAGLPPGINYGRTWLKSTGANGTGELFTQQAAAIPAGVADVARIGASMNDMGTYSPPAPIKLLPDSGLLLVNTTLATNFNVTFEVDEQ